MIGKNIKQLREEQGYTKESLAKISGIGEKYISAIESGHRTPGKNTIAKLCDVLMVDEPTLRFGERPVCNHMDSPERAAIQQEISDLSLDELLEVRLLLRKWKRDHKLIDA